MNSSEAPSVSAARPPAPSGSGSSANRLERTALIIQITYSLGCCSLAIHGLVNEAHSLPVAAVLLPTLQVFPTHVVWPRLTRAILPVSLGMLVPLVGLTPIIGWQFGVNIFLGLMFVLLGWNFRIRLAEPPGLRLTPHRFAVSLAALASGALYLGLMALLRW
jgi:hypothetical protein